MHIIALVQVIDYLKEKAADQSVNEGYKKLAEIIRDASKNPSDDNWPAILKGKEQLRTILLESEPAEWGYEKYGIFEKINTGGLFGKAACDFLDKLVTADNKDYQAISAELTKKSKQFSKASENLSKFMQMYDTVVPDDIDQPAGTPSKSSILLYFEGKLSVHNVTDLERYSGLWDSILSVFSGLNGEEKPELDINSYHNGKITLEVAPGEKTFSALISGTSGVLALLPLILKVRNIQLELAPLPLSNSVNDLLEQEIEDLVNNNSLEKSNKLILSHFKGAYDPDEISADLTRSLKQIFSFIEKGGKIEFKPVGQMAEASKVNRELAESYSIARELEKLAQKLVEDIERKDEYQAGKG